MKSVATHVAPAWGRKANFLIRADLAGYGMPNRSEQLWARKVGERLFEVCCLPFFTYGITLGDTVETNDQFTVQRVLNKSGHKTLRVALANKDRLPELHELHEHIHGWLDSNEFLYEWYASGYLAVDVTSVTQQGLLVQFLQGLAAGGDLYYEIDE
jgi:hypothetical protein